MLLWHISAMPLDRSNGERRKRLLIALVALYAVLIGQPSEATTTTAEPPPQLGPTAPDRPAKLLYRKQTVAELMLVRGGYLVEIFHRGIVVRNVATGAERWRHFETGSFIEVRGSDIRLTNEWISVQFLTGDSSTGDRHWRTFDLQTGQVRPGDEHTFYTRPGLALSLTSGHLVARDDVGGAVLWTIPDPDYVAHGNEIVEPHPGLLVLKGDGPYQSAGSFTAIDAASGALLWHKRYDGSNHHLFDTDHPALVGAVTHRTRHSMHVEVLDLRSGDIVAATEISTPMSSHRIVVAGQAVCGVDDDTRKTLACYKLRSGAILWKQDRLPALVDYVTVVGQEIILVAESAGHPPRVAAYRVSDGDLTWSMDLAAAPQSDSRVIAHRDGVLVLRDRAGIAVHGNLAS